MQKVKVIGAGLAGCEAALYLAKRDIAVELYDIKPRSFTPAHHSPEFAELVCSNSLKSKDVFGNAAGLLKEEMKRLGSIVMRAADKTQIPAGGALAVDRNKFAAFVTQAIESEPRISVFCREITDIDYDDYTIVATGPLTTDALAENIAGKLGVGLYFYDASAPIVAFDGIDMSEAFFGDRYDRGNGDHINCPMTKDEYTEFVNALLSAERVSLHGFENSAVFEGCMPIEVMAARGEDTLRFGPLKPVGLTDPRTGRWAYACLQLRKEDAAGSMYNLVGFQTNLKFGEQKRVFSMIPALKNAEFLRYGVMHRNTFINSPKVLSADYSLKDHGKTFFAGQITGVEGYIESAGSGLMAAIYCERKLRGKKKTLISDYTVLGALARYITSENGSFQPMNANFGILPPPEERIRDKAERKKYLAERSLRDINIFIKEITA